MQIEVDIEVFGKLVATELTEAIAQFEDDLAKLKDGNPNRCGIFSIDKKEDKQQIKKMIKAMKRVRTWYGVGYEL